MSLSDTPVADGDNVFAEFINQSSGSDHPWVRTNQDDVNLGDYLNLAIRAVAIENPQPCVSSPSLALDSTLAHSKNNGTTSFWLIGHPSLLFVLRLHSMSPNPSPDPHPLLSITALPLTFLVAPFLTCHSCHVIRVVVLGCRFEEQSCIISDSCVV